MSGAWRVQYDCHQSHITKSQLQPTKQYFPLYKHKHKIISRFLNLTMFLRWIGVLTSLAQLLSTSPTLYRAVHTSIKNIYYQWFGCSCSHVTKCSLKGSFNLTNKQTDSDITLWEHTDGWPSVRPRLPVPSFEPVFTYKWLTLITELISYCAF